jgi:hypothetical protein
MAKGGGFEGALLLMLEKMQNKELIEPIIKILPIEGKGFLVHYGRVNGRDIDLFGVLEEELEVTWNLGVIDLYLIGIKTCEQLIKFKDPKIVEPILNGRLLIGNENFFHNLKKSLLENPVDEEVISYLVRRGIEEILTSRQWLEHYKISTNPRLAYNSLVSLSYSYTYLLSAHLYTENKNSVITMNEILRVSDQFKKIVEFLEQTKDGKNVSYEKTNSLMRQWEIQIAKTIK